MKRYDKITGVLAVAALSLFSACSEDTMDRINKDHGHITSVASRFILADVIASTAFPNASGDTNTYVPSYIEYEVGVDSQLYYARIHENEPSSSSALDNSWSGVYSSSKNVRIIIDQCDEGGRDHDNDVTRGVAEVMTAYNCASIADFFGDVPCSQAALVDGKGSPVYMTPKMDAQQEIYAQIISYLDGAIADLQKEDLTDVTEQDFLYANDANKWLKFAYGLKARYIVRLISRPNNKSADYEKMLDYISKSFTPTDDQAAFDIYDSSSINPFYSFYNSRTGFGASTSLNTKLLAYSDPRANRTFFIPIVDKKRSQVAANGPSLIPTPGGSPDQSTSEYGISTFVYAKTAPTLPMSYHEPMFLKAETLCHLNRDAEDALKEVVVAGLLDAEGSISTTIKELGSGLNINSSKVITETSTEKYFDSVMKAKHAANPLQETIIQKYLAMWGASSEVTETYDDFRRMKGLSESFITLTNPNNSSKFPLRYPYGNSDTAANPEMKAAYGNGDYIYSEPVWWASESRQESLLKSLKGETLYGVVPKL